MEVCVSAGIVAVKMGNDELLDGQRRDLLDRSSDLVVERRKLATMIMASVPTATVMFPPRPWSM
jgi:hypothetical protein